MNRLILDNNIYSRYIVEKAINDYSEVAKIILGIKKEKMICKFSDSIYDVEKTIKEFENYIIDLSNSCKDFGYDS